MRDLLDTIIQTSIAENQPRTRPWTRKEDNFLTENLGRLSVEQCGQEIGRSRNAVKVHYTRMGLKAPSQQRTVWLNGNIAARLLSMEWKTMALLARRKILPIQYLKLDKRIFSRIKRISLYVWAVNPENWIYFKPERVRDPILRRLIELRRIRWVDEWLTVGQVARICGKDRRFINHFINSGRLPARRWGNWHIKLSDLMANPPDPSRRKYIFSERADEFILKAREDLHLNFPAIGRMMKIYDEQVRLRYWQLKNGTKK